MVSLVSPYLKTGIQRLEDLHPYTTLHPFLRTRQVRERGKRKAGICGLEDVEVTTQRRIVQGCCTHLARCAFSISFSPRCWLAREGGMSGPSSNRSGNSFAFSWGRRNSICSKPSQHRTFRQTTEHDGTCYQSPPQVPQSFLLFDL